MKTLALLLSSFTYAQIPFEQTLGLYDGTQDDKKHISPLWAISALYTQQLENIRLYGNYHDKDDKDVANDPIAKLIQELFPCPDGVQFVANTLSKNAAGDLSRNLASINDLLKALDNNSTIETIINLLPGKAKNKTKFAELLVNAFNEQNNLANPSQESQQLYPENIVPLSLIAFFCKVADNKSELAKLSYVMKDNFDQTKVFTREQYDLKDMNMLQNPEGAFLMGYGYDKWENPNAQLITYRGDTFFNNPRNIFPDCGETSLRNLLYALLKDKDINEIEKKLEGDLTTFKKLKGFLATYPTLDVTLQAHVDWAGIVSNLNKASNSLDDVAYGHGLSSEPYEIKASAGVAKGLFNMLNVLKHLFPDPVLGKPWNQNNINAQAAEKLTRFCEILSVADHKVTWANKKEKQLVRGPFLDIMFKLSDYVGYRLDCLPQHFQLYQSKRYLSDWRQEVAGYSKNFWLNNLYIQSNDSAILDEVFKHIYLEKHVEEQTIPESIIRLIPKVLSEDKKQFHPLIKRWIQNFCPKDDKYIMERLAITLYGYNQHPVTKEILDDKNFFYLNQKIKELQSNPRFAISAAAFSFLSEGVLDKTIIELLNNNLVDVNALENTDIYEDDIGKYYRPLLWFALQSKNIDVVNAFLEHPKLNPNTANTDNETTLHWIAFSAMENYENVSTLITKGADVNYKDKKGKTPLDWCNNNHGKEGEILLDTHIKLTEILLKHGAKRGCELT